jgi:hypothetical protein
VTIGPRSQCDTCARYRSPFSDENTRDLDGPFCAAFPDGIPTRVVLNGLDHRQPITGDHGLRWLSDGDDFPEYAFLPEFLGRGTA